MGLILLESFDGPGTAEANYEGQKWTDVVFAGGSAPNTGDGRNGRGSHIADSSNGVHLRRAFSSAEEDDLIIVGFAMRPATVATVSDFLDFDSDTGATEHIHLRTLSSGQLAILRSSTEIARTADSVYTANAWHYVEMKARLSDSTSDLAIRVNGVAKTLTPAGPYDTKNGGTKTVFDQIKFVQNNVSVPDIDIDDIYIMNERTDGDFAGGPTDFLGDTRIEVLRPNADSGTVEWGTSSGSDHRALVDEQTPDDADYVVWRDGTDALNERDVWELSALTGTTGTVRGIQIVVRALKTSTDTREMQIVCQSSGGANQSLSGNKTISTTADQYVYIPNQEPGAATWDRTKIDAARVGVRVVT